MRQRRSTEGQIIDVLKEGGGGITVKEICRQHTICRQPYYRGKAKYGGLGVSEARRPSPDEGNRRLKQMMAESAVDLQTLKAVLGKCSEGCGEARGRGRFSRPCPARRRSPPLFAGNPLPFPELPEGLLVPDPQVREVGNALNNSLLGG
jgi:putative transposase